MFSTKELWPFAKCLNQKLGKGVSGQLEQEWLLHMNAGTLTLLVTRETQDIQSCQCPRLLFMQ